MVISCKLFLELFVKSFIFISSLKLIHAKFAAGITNTGNESPADFVDYYEITKLDIRALENVNDGANKGRKRAGILLSLNAFHRKFSATLWPDDKVFQTNIQIKIISNRTEDIKYLSENLIYEGKLTDEKKSRVSGYFTQKGFNGKISVQHGNTFYVEPSPMNESKNTVIIYREKDIIENRTQCSNIFRVLRTPASDHVAKRRRSKRSPHYHSCPLLIAADSLFYKHVGKNSIHTTVAKMAYYVSEADKIFRSTIFFGGEHKSIGFVIASLAVYKDPESEGIFSSPTNIAIDEYLKRWSKLDHDKYCLSLLVTYRDFSKGVVGLAWLAEVNKLGGICEPWSTYYGMSFNTAVVTFLNHGKRIGDRMAILTVSHEFGHSFGAQHDPEECQPGGSEGNYIMYEHSSDTAHPNNDKFSPCSIADMRRVLQARLEECFTDGKSYCGNEIIEAGEQCDCGDKADCHIRDHCCVARDEELGIPGCNLKSTAQCSPKAGACCTNECTFYNDTKKKVCQEETECSFTSYCSNGACPTAEHKDDKKICNNGSNVCKDGECKGSICSYYALNQCPCTEMGYLCQVCCNNTVGKCVPSSQLTGRVVILPDKTPCGDNMYCDNIGQCLKHTDKYYQQRNVGSVIIDWLKNKWYIFMFIAIAAASKIMLFSYYGYRKWRVRRSSRHEAQLEELGSTHTEYPSSLQLESHQQTRSENM